MSAAFRVDASARIGGGHFARCLTLASALRERGHAARFLCRDLPPSLREEARAAGVAVDALSVPDGAWDTDARETAAALAAGGACSVLVVDHYGLDARWERAMRAAAGKIMVIDDLDDRPHDCDLLLDLGAVTERARLPAAARSPAPRTLTGPDFALLREEFAAARRASGPRLKGVSRILAAFGGSDPTGETEKAIAAIRALRRADIYADIVVGSMNPRRQAIESLCAEQPRLAFHAGPRNLAELMSRADLGVGAAGGTAWERCCLFLPSVIIAVAANQNAIAEGIAGRGAAVNLGWHEGVGVATLRDALEALSAAPERVAELSRSAGELVDGEGVRRVLSAMEEAKCI